MNNQYLPPYRAVKLNGIWSVINAVGQTDAACDCRCSAEDLAREMTSYARRMHGIGMHDSSGRYDDEDSPHPTFTEEA